MENKKQYKESSFGRYFGAVIAAVINIGFIYLLYYYIDYLTIGHPEVRYPIFEYNLGGVLPYVYVSLILQAFGQIFIAIVNRFAFTQILRILLDIFSFAILVALIVVFPFDFSGFQGTTLSFFTDNVAYAILFLGAAGTLISIIVAFVKTISYLVKGEKE